ncbi:(d)CMP kinase [Candidatus Bipolaricaulota bacterium]|nr:(d)CMP kinase [Candidatus Bipolaricaulota bacterium]
MQIAIDGPAASGKTSLGAALAQQFGYLFAETGKMYRAVALGLGRGLKLDEIDISVDRNNHFLLNGEDVTDLLHSPRLDEAASRAATRPEVRRKLVSLQQQIARGRDIVMEGRDIGTVVLPQAEIKIFLEARTSSRARRRMKQRKELDFRTTLREIIARDERDSTRDIAPLNPARDAIIMNTDQKSLEEVICEATDLVKEYLEGHCCVQ